MKNEAPYLLEWVAYHRAIGFDRIVVVSNDCTDGTAELLDALQKAGVVEHFRQEVKSGKSAQASAADLAQQAVRLNDGDWALWLDADEFLNIHAGAGTVPDLVEHIGQHHGMFIAWRLFGDSGWHRFPGRFISPDFALAASPKNPLTREGKMIFRHSPAVLGFSRRIHRPALVANSGLMVGDFLNGTGAALHDKVSSHRRWISGDSDFELCHVDRRDFGWSVAQINHYSVRTPDHFVLKRLRGRGFRAKQAGNRNQRHTADFYARMNTNEEEDRTILRFAEATDAAIERLLGHRAVRVAQRRAWRLTGVVLKRLERTDTRRKIGLLPAGSAVRGDQLDEQQVAWSGSGGRDEFSRVVGFSDPQEEYGMVAGKSTKAVPAKAAGVAKAATRKKAGAEPPTAPAKAAVVAKTAVKKAEGLTKTSTRPPVNAAEKTPVKKPSAAKPAAAKPVAKARRAVETASPPAGSPPAVKPLKLFWWSAKRNFGDAISELVVAHISRRPVEWADVEQAEIFAVGSILQIALRHYAKRQPHRPWIWGSGLIKPAAQEIVPNVRIAALRGPQTAAALNVTPTAYGDPGILIGEVLTKRPRRTARIGIVPHLNHLKDGGVLQAVKDTPNGKLIDVTLKDPMEVLRQIAACRHIYSSSLHGLVVADALGIPNTWVDPTGIHKSAKFKFEDYAEGIGRTLGKPIAFAEIPAHVATLEDGPLPYAQTLDAAKVKLKAAFPPRLRADGFGRWAAKQERQKHARRSKSPR